MSVSFPFFSQLDSKDCGPTCLRMIAKHYGRHYTLESLRQRCHISREGVSLLGISAAAEEIGFNTLGVHLSFEQLKSEAPLPCIVHWRQNHFVVVYKIRRGKVYVADPGAGLLQYSEKEFLGGWISRKGDDASDEGIALLLEPQPEFYAAEGEKPDKAKFSFVLQYLKPYRKLIVQLFLGMLMGTLLQLIFPFFTQSIVDYGIGNSNLGFVTLILVAQLTLYAAQTAVEFIRSWILLHISTRINISIISDFLIKLMKLPIGFFDTKMIGDLMQRIGDHRRIESFLTSSTLNTLFSFVTLIVFACVLAFYSLKLAIAYPNPGHDKLNIRTALPDARVEVYDANGRLVHSQGITENVTSINAEAWAEGVYVWKVYSGVSTLRCFDKLSNRSSATAGSTTLAESGKWIKE